ncbi:flavin reductase family protein [Tropicibacter naphthalenivorans]|uniref:4-hydroxyphenylacetate 3-monooxygenase reductase component n=1 Tax=Tropicibacter naphthalenivorans TaxID=441103 RepID=A0A0P1GHP3_9RHOB|nr:flavin reductase family protein [Tropicibacter naphthalenivorans]CUH81222.1 4-hydroxyphenylacetate 3-monooxygenase reductase component [Tropicibacter naphthalenivorans]SMC97772.1 flavin reductase [Tropicibacter naphthalenivorans]
MVTIDTFRAALAELAAGVNIVTTQLDGERRGITATAVTSVCAEPATILACTNMNTGTYAMIRDAGVFAVNILGGDDRAVAETFAGRGGVTGDARFETGHWRHGDALGLPVLAGATSLECEVAEIVTSGTHAVIFGHVKGASIQGIAPLVYHAGGFRGLTDMKLAS